jgi:regulator of CtrA degradation
MTRLATLNARIIEGLYCEALVLAEEVRAAFSLSGRIERAGQDEDLARVALSCVGLRTTTRMMHAIAWLLNHRAYLKGELSEFQLRRYGALAADDRGTDPANFDLLDEDVRGLVEATEQFYARLLRLDHAWRQRQPEVPPGALQRLRQRLGSAASR